MKISPKRIAVAGLLLVILIAYLIHLDPWKNSILFQRLINISDTESKYPVDLLTGYEETLLSADGEADSLLMDGFTYQSAGPSDAVILCGKWTFPSERPARFTRDGSIFRGDNHVFVVELYVTDICGVQKAEGRAGPVPFL